MMISRMISHARLRNWVGVGGACCAGAMLAGGCAVIPAEERRIVITPENEAVAEVAHPDHVAALEIDPQGRYSLIAPDGGRLWPVNPEDEMSLLHPEAIDELRREDGRSPVLIRPGRERAPLLSDF